MTPAAEVQVILFHKIAVILESLAVLNTDNKPPPPSSNFQNTWVGSYTLIWCTLKELLLAATFNKTIASYM